jgi:predicted transcriptional regulator
MQGNWDYLTKLPHELLHNILKGVDPPDLEALSKTCQKLRSFTKDNHQLFKDIYATYLVSVHLERGIDHVLTSKGRSSR